MKKKAKQGRTAKKQNRKSLKVPRGELGRTVISPGKRTPGEGNGKIIE